MVNTLLSLFFLKHQFGCKQKSQILLNYKGILGFIKKKPGTMKGFVLEFHHVIIVSFSYFSTTMNVEDETERLKPESEQ